MEGNAKEYMNTGRGRTGGETSPGLDVGVVDAERALRLKEGKDSSCATNEGGLHRGNWERPLQSVLKTSND